MTEGQTVNRIQILRNDLFGEIEVLQTHSQTYIAKRLTAKSAAVFERAHKSFPFLFSNEFPFLQEFMGQTELFGGTYLLFKYHDYSLQNLLDADRRAGLALPENMLFKLLNDLLFVLNFFKARGLAYPFLHHKTVFISKTGNLKLTNPLLFEEAFVNLDRVSDEPQALLATDRRIAEAAKIVLEQATFASLFGPEATPTDFAQALRALQPRYSYDFYNLMRKFDYLGGARVPGESNFQNVNVSDNFFNVNCSNVDKYLAGVRVAPVDFEIPKTFAAKVYTIKNGAITKLPEVRSGIFDSQAAPARSPVNVSQGAPGVQVSDVPVNQARRIFDTPAPPVGVTDVSLKTETPGVYSNMRSSSMSAAYAQAYTQADGQNSFTKKKAEDSFFDDVFERQAAALQQGPPVRVSMASQESLPAAPPHTPQAVPQSPQTPQTVPRLPSLPSQHSVAPDNFFDVPTHFQPTPQNYQSNPQTEHNISASFRQNPFYHPHDSSASDHRRSRSSNLVEGRIHAPLPQEAPLNPHPGSAFIDPNESFSKRLAQFYQQEYQERNDSMRDSAVSHPVSGPRTSGTQDFYAGRAKPGDKSYAVIHDFPVQG